MQLGSSVVVNKSKQEVWNFLAEPQNIGKWDRGVKAVEAGEADVSPGEGFEFTTVGHDAARSNEGRMSYRIGRTDPEAGCRVDLVSQDGNARYFKSAYWWLGVKETSGSGAERKSRVECLVHFDLRLRYVWLAPVLFFMKGAIRRDLIGLKRVLEGAG